MLGHNGAEAMKNINSAIRDNAVSECTRKIYLFKKFINWKFKFRNQKRSQSKSMTKI